MKKKILMIVMAFIFCLSLPLGVINNKPYKNTYDYSKFLSDVSAISKNDNLQTIMIDKDASLEVVKSIFTDKTSSVNQGIFDDNANFSDAKSYLLQNGYIASEEGDRLSVYSKFQLKRLIVSGVVKNTYGATKVIDGYKDYSILCYETEEATEQAYNELLKNKSLSVSVDSILSADGYADNIYDYSTYKTGWGAEAVSVARKTDADRMMSLEIVFILS